MTRFMHALPFVLLATACAAEPTGPQIPESIDPTDIVRNRTTPTDRGPSSLSPAEEGAEGQRARRLTVDQLRQSIPALFGGLTWRVDTPDGNVEGLTALSRTLGEADYIQTTEPNTEPSALFAKFMDDLAANVCQQAIERDARGGGEALVVQHPEDPAENLRFLRLKLHGIYVPAESTEGLQDYSRLYDEILASTADANQAWWGVCIAFITAPEFMAY